MTDLGEIYEGERRGAAQTSGCNVANLPWRERHRRREEGQLQLSSDINDSIVTLLTALFAPVHFVVI